MAKNAPSISMPCDEPLRVSQGVSLVESDYHGFAKYGAIQGHDGSTPVGHTKGNRVAAGMVPRQELINGVSPLGFITGGKR
jgi:hypothetical protein